MDVKWAAQLPAAISMADFVAALGGTPDHACCVFTADGVDVAERRGYAALVVAYSREGEPVTVLEDGSAALLICQGGVTAGVAAAERILRQAARAGLDVDLRVGVSGVSDDVPLALASARRAAEGIRPGTVAAA